MDLAAFLHSFELLKMSNKFGCLECGVFGKTAIELVLFVLTHS